eukprot:TRINITY_DN11469_c0_g1_i2.p1 TRINITY_DN11469_c0_g1~~TRINITY_DN11469_c0_g1_i2.p1  ORF type:complete len:424 (-),score=105.02 TRINITY_DN11469_c0_g1_i2:300-1571(-)
MLNMFTMPLFLLLIMIKQWYQRRVRGTTVKLIPTRLQLSQFVSDVRQTPVPLVVCRLLSDSLDHPDWKRRLKALHAIHELVSNEVKPSREYFMTTGLSRLLAQGQSVQQSVRDKAIQLVQMLSVPNQGTSGDGSGGVGYGDGVGTRGYSQIHEPRASPQSGEREEGREDASTIQEPIPLPMPSPQVQEHAQQPHRQSRLTTDFPTTISTTLPTISQPPQPNQESIFSIISQSNFSEPSPSLVDFREISSANREQFQPHHQQDLVDPPSRKLFPSSEGNRSSQSQLEEIFMEGRNKAVIMEMFSYSPAGGVGVGGELTATMPASGTLYGVASTAATYPPHVGGPFVGVAPAYHPSYTSFHAAPGYFSSGYGSSSVPAGGYVPPGGGGASRGVGTVSSNFSFVTTPTTKRDPFDFGDLNQLASNM